MRFAKILILGAGGIILIIALLALGKFVWDTQKKVVVSVEPPETAEVVKIIDPITVKLDTGHIIRYVGVRNPDVTAEIRCFGKESLLANESMIGKKIRIEKEPIINQSKDGAWVRYVFFDANTDKATTLKTTTPEDNKLIQEKKEIFVNERILEMGLGFPLVSEDMKHGERMISAARYASATKKGLWSQCEVDSKQTANGTFFNTQVIKDCVIKGKINVDGKKIYRLPNCPAYRETMVIQAEGGKWFCAQDTARENGFEKADDCEK